MQVIKPDQVIAGQDSLYASACIDKNANELIIKIANTIGKEQMLSFNLSGWKNSDAKASMSVLSNNDMNGVNSFEQPLAIVPVNKEVEVKNKMLNTILSPNSFSVIRLKL